MLVGVSGTARLRPPSSLPPKPVPSLNSDSSMPLARPTSAAVDVLPHHVVDLVGTVVVEDFLLGQADRGDAHFGREERVVEQFLRRVGEDVVAAVPLDRGQVDEEGLPDPRPAIGLPQALATQDVEKRDGVRTMSCQDDERSSSAMERTC